MPVILQVALGGAVGAMLRFGSVNAAARLFGAGFPYGTLFVNVLGSFIMGLAAVYLFTRLDGRYTPLLMTGVLGGFTTFSAFSLDAVKLFESGRMLAAGAYIGGSVLLAIVALLAGMSLMKAIL